MNNHQLQQALLSLREYALSLNLKAKMSLHQEDSHLVRLANGNISLNTTQQVTTLKVTAYGEKRTASASLICDIKDRERMRACVKQAQGMLPFASPLTFQPTLPAIPLDSHFESNYDQALAQISNEDILAYINTAAGDLEDDDIKLGGSFSVGSAAWCTLSTATPHTVSWRLSDAQITLVLASQKDKWEINAEQSAEKLTDLHPEKLNRRLAFLKDKYLRCPAVQMPLSPCRVVFGPAATAEYLYFLGWCGLNGNTMKHGMSIHREEDVGKQVLSSKVTVTEGPENPGTFPLPVDDHGRARAVKAWYQEGVLSGFIWDQNTADEFGQTPTGHDLAHESFALLPGDCPTNDIFALAEAPRDADILYVPYLHYTGVVNPSEGLITGTSRFGALLLKQDGSIQVPYNVRFTEKLKDIFGGKLLWLSCQSEAYNLSDSYGQRNPQALLVPGLMCCDAIQIEISNKSY